MKAKRDDNGNINAPQAPYSTILKRLYLYVHATWALHWQLNLKRIEEVKMKGEIVRGAARQSAQFE